jgi:uncharacterized protein YbjT (DUF2867 family)
MRILLIGADGFIGSRLAARLHAEGHQVIPATHARTDGVTRPPKEEALSVDLTRDDCEAWLPRLESIDAVINAAGAMGGDLDALHAIGPIALFEACARRAIGRVIQISALGAHMAAETEFLRSKARADAHLMELRDRHGFHGWSVLRPSIVLGRGGGSMALFSALAALPFPLRLGRGDWRIQPLHVNDLTAAIAHLLGSDIPTPACLNLVGPEELTTDQLTQILRQWLGLPAARMLTLSENALALMANIGSWLPNAPWRKETMTMLQRGNTADPMPARSYGITILPLAEALTREPATQSDVMHARLMPLLPAIRVALGITWIGSGVIPLMLTPEAVNRSLLAGLGLTDHLGKIVLYAGSALDVAIGLGLLLKQRPATWFLLAQIGAIFFLTLLASLAAPGAWVDPFAPLLKNLALLAATLALFAVRR